MKNGIYSVLMRKYIGLVSLVKHPKICGTELDNYMIFKYGMFQIWRHKETKKHPFSKYGNRVDDKNFFLNECTK